MLAPTKHRFSVKEYYRMAETGILPQDARVELLNGLIIDLPKITPFHSGTTMRLNQWFNPNSEIKTASRHQSVGLKRFGKLAAPASAIQLPI